MQKKTIYRLASLFILVALVFGSTLMVHATMQLAPLDALAVTVNPVADAYVIASSPSSNYGTSASLRVDGSPVTRSYLRFSVSGLGGAAVQSAMLRIYANSANTSGFSVLALSNNSWAEKTITYSNAPAPGNTIATSSSVAAATWVQVDISSYIKAAGTYNLVLTTTNKTNTNLAARENTAGHAPQLVVTPAGGQATATTGTKPTNTSLPTSQFTPTKTATPVGNPTATSTPSSGSCTAVILTKGPTLIYTGDNTKMRVFWQWTSNATFQVQWGTSTSYGLGNVAVKPTNTSTFLYTYDISGLTSATKYYYRVVVGSQCSSGTFYAGPAANATNIKFFSYGDTRTNGSIHNGLAGQVVAVYKADPAFQTLNLNVGDWVSADSASAWSSEWFATSYTNLRTQDANLSDIGNRGNHEGAATFWRQYWPEPFQPSGLYWSFDYGPMHVDVLDQYTSYGPGSTEYNWLKADLAATTKTWKFVMLHEPGWSAGGGHANNTTVQNDLQPLFQQYGVSVVFAGHNHYYCRAMVNGIVELTLGGGGAPQYTPAAGQPDIVTYTKAYSFGEFTISGNTLTAKVISNTGATIDTFTVTK
jgi:hypothetical protein